MFNTIVERGIITNTDKKHIQPAVAIPNRYLYVRGIELTVAF
jgi:hypothetical protein